MVKVSINRYAGKRIEESERDIEKYMQTLRKRLVKNMDELFQLTAKIVRGEIKHQRINGRMTRITLKQKRKWLKIAEQAAETIKRASENIDEQEIKTRLKEIKELISQMEQADSNR